MNIRHEIWVLVPDAVLQRIEKALPKFDPYKTSDTWVEVDSSIYMNVFEPSGRRAYERMNR